MNTYEFWDELGNIFDAVAAYQQKTIEFNRRFINPWIRLGPVFDKEDRSQEVIAAYQKALEIDPANAENWHELGNVYFNTGAHSDAAGAYRKAIELDPGSAWSYSNLAQTLVQLGEYRDAVELYKKSIDLFDQEKDKAVSWNRLGNVYRKLEEYDAALQAFQQADKFEADSAASQTESAKAALIPTPTSEDKTPAVELNQVQEDFVQAQKPAEQRAVEESMTEGIPAQEIPVAETPTIAGHPENTVPPSQELGVEEAGVGMVVENAPVPLPETAELTGKVEASPEPAPLLPVAEAIPMVELPAIAEPQLVQIPPETVELTEKVEVSPEPDPLPPTVEVVPGVEVPVVGESQPVQTLPEPAELAEKAENAPRDTLSSAAAEAIPAVNVPIVVEPQPIQTPPVNTQLPEEYLDTQNAVTTPISYTTPSEMIDAPQEATLATPEAASPENIPAADNQVTGHEESDHNLDILLEMVAVKIAPTEDAGGEALPQSDTDEKLVEVPASSSRSMVDSTLEDELFPVPEMTEKDVKGDAPFPVLEESKQNLEDPNGLLEEFDNLAGKLETNNDQISADTNNASVWNELGNVYFNSGAYADAITAYNKAIELDPWFAWPYSNLALVHFNEGKCEEAIRLYQKSIDLFTVVKDKAVTWNRLGNVYRRLNNYESAIFAYQRADELDPNHAALSMQSHVNLLGGQLAELGLQTSR